MSRLKLREIALISMPLVLIGGFGWWSNVRQTQRAERESGAYRTRLVSIEDLPLTPFERWQGFDSKVRIVATDDGAPNLPTDVKLTGRRALESEIFLIDQGVNKLPVSSNGLGNDGVSGRYPGALLRIYDFAKSRAEAENLEITFLADADAVAGDQARLRGTIAVENGTYEDLSYAQLSSGFKSWRGRKDLLTFEARPLQIDHPLRASERPVDRTTPRLLSTQVSRLSPRETATDMAGDNGDTFVRATFDCSALPAITPSFRFADSSLKNEVGKKIEKLHIGGIGTRSDGIVVLDDRIKTLQIPADQGQLTFETWFSYRGSWPVPVSIVVRPRPYKGAPRKLTLQKAEFIDEPGQPRIQVRVRYTGTLSLETEQSVPRQYDTLTHDMKPVPKHAGIDRLLSNWSQRLEYAGGKTQWSEQYIGDARAECNSDNSCIVTYPLPAVNNWKPGQSARFRAQIGIEDNGFLNVDVPLTGFR